MQEDSKNLTILKSLFDLNYKNKNYSSFIYRLIKISIEYTEIVALCNAYNKYGRFLAIDLVEYQKYL